MKKIHIQYKKEFRRKVQYTQSTVYTIQYMYTCTCALCFKHSVTVYLPMGKYPTMDWPFPGGCFPKHSLQLSVKKSPKKR